MSAKPNRRRRRTSFAADAVVLVTTGQTDPAISAD